MESDSGVHRGHGEEGGVPFCPMTQGQACPHQQDSWLGQCLFTAGACRVACSPSVLRSL